MNPGARDPWPGIGAGAAHRKLSPRKANQRLPALNLSEAPQVAVRLAEPGDAGAIAGLIHALEIHYGGKTCPLESTLAMVRASMAEQEGTRHALAFVAGRAP